MRAQCNEPAYMVGYLRAFLDGEGHVSVGNKQLTFANTDPALIQHVRDCLDGLGIGHRVQLLPRKKRGYRDLWNVIVGRRRDVIRFARVVSVTAPSKRYALAQVLKWYRRPPRAFRSQWDDDATLPDRQRLSELLDRGLTFKAIGLVMGMHELTVARYARSYGLVPPRSIHIQPDPEEVRRLYWDEGLTAEEIAPRFGYKACGLRDFMARHGIPRRPQHFHSTRITMDQAIEMRKRYAKGDISLRELGAAYGIGKGGTFDVVKGRNWHIS